MSPQRWQDQTPRLYNFLLEILLKESVAINIAKAAATIATTDINKTKAVATIVTTATTIETEGTTIATTAVYIYSYSFY